MMMKVTPRRTDAPLASSSGTCLPSCARRRRATMSCAAPLTAAQTPKTTKAAATLRVAATPRAMAARMLHPALISSHCRADPCWLRASISVATASISG
jgi:hypothetical protein